MFNNSITILFDGEPIEVYSVERHIDKKRYRPSVEYRWTFILENSALEVLSGPREPDYFPESLEPVAIYPRKDDDPHSAVATVHFLSNEIKAVEHVRDIHVRKLTKDELTLVLDYEGRKRAQPSSDRKHTNSKKSARKRIKKDHAFTSPDGWRSIFLRDDLYKRFRYNRTVMQKTLAFLENEHPKWVSADDVATATGLNAQNPNQSFKSDQETKTIFAHVLEEKTDTVNGCQVKYLRMKKNH